MPHTEKIDLILRELDACFAKNDMLSAKCLLESRLTDALENNDKQTEFFVRNELLGVYRKQGQKETALAAVDAVLRLIDEMKIGEQIGAATAYINCATVYKAFSMAKQAMPLFENAVRIYERKLPSDDRRLGGLYNNMALALVDLKAFSAAKQFYRKAILIAQQAKNGAPEHAVTLLNLASAAEAEKGAVLAEEEIGAYLAEAEALLNACPMRDGNYAFVCEKCASVFDYYGFFAFAEELRTRAKEIYGR